MELRRSNFMLSKKNYKEKLRKMEPRQERFSIRKFSIGAASVLIGLSFMSMTGNQKVQAAEQQEKPAVVQNAEQQEEPAAVQNAKDNEQSQSSAEATDSQLTKSPIQESSTADTKGDSDSSKTTTANDKGEQKDAGDNNVSTQTTTLAINNTNTNGSQSRDKAGDSDVSTQTTALDLNRDKKLATLFSSFVAVPPTPNSSQGQKDLVFTPQANDVVTHKTSDKNIIGEPVIENFKLNYYQGGQNYSKPYIYTLNADKTKYVLTQTGDNPAGVTVNAPQSIDASDINISWTADGTVLFNNALGPIKGHGQPSSLASDKNGGTGTITYTQWVNDQFGYRKYSAVINSSRVNWPIYGKGPVSIHSYPSVYIYGAEANGIIPSVNSDVTDLKDTLGDASKFVNTGDLTADHNAEIKSIGWQTLPSLDKANAQAPATVRINFTDGSYLDVPVHVNVIKVDQGVDDKTNHDIYRDITRTINVEGESTPVVQHVIYSRAKMTDLSKPAGQQISYTDWAAAKNSKGQLVTNFPRYEVTKPGYTATAAGATIETVDGKQYVPASALITPDSPNETVDVTYTQTLQSTDPTINPNKPGDNSDMFASPTEGQVTIIYRDANGNEVGRTTISGTEGSTIDPSSAIKNGVPVGYKIKDGYNAPTSASVSSSITVPVVKTDNGGNTTPSDNKLTDKTPGKDDNSGKKVDHHKAKNNGQNIRTETKHNSGNNQAAGLNSENHSYNSNVHGERANSNNTAVQAEKNAKTLPQTGEKQDRASIIGLALASIAGLLGFGVDRKRKHN